MSAVHEVSLEARAIVQDAFDGFEKVATPGDFIIFQDTSLKDVEHSARNLENTLAPRKGITNTGRLSPVFTAFARYEKAAAKLHHDMTSMPLLWAPIRLTLEVTGEHKPVLTLLLAAYKRIARTVPDFEDPSIILRDGVEFQQILAAFYFDIVDFHGRVYTQLRKPGWTTFFEFFWDKSKRRLELMLQGLLTYGELLRKTPTSQEVEEARMLQQRKTEDVAAYEEKQDVAELTNVHSWLDASKLDQDDMLDDLHLHCHEGSCDWILEHAKVRSWIRQGADHNVLWLKGKPGSGKSVLCGKLVQHLSESKDTVIIYYFCNEALPETKLCLSLLRSLIQQLVQIQPSLCAFIQKEFVNKRFKSSAKQLREILQNLLVAFKSVRVIADGIDECDEREQKSMLTELIALTSFDASKRGCKVMISSQDIVSISRVLRDRSIIDLSNERAAMQTAISAFVHSRIERSHLFSNADVSDNEALKKAEQTLVDKADGMFLWVELVVSMLENAYTPQEIQQALVDVPNDLEKVYQKIITRIEEQAERSNSDRASRIFQWLTCSYRQLRKYELQDAVTLHPKNPTISEETRAHEQVFELCKPLVESSTGEVVRFVHATVKDFLLKDPPALQFFDLPTAQANATFSCLAYLDFGVTLIDDEYDDESRLVEVGKGLHGLCQYACRYWVEHLLAYLRLAQDTSHASRDFILKTANSLAQTLSTSMGPELLTHNPQRFEKLAKLDGRTSLAKGHEPLYSLILSTMEIYLEEKISPKNGAGDTKEKASHPIRMIRRKYESLVAQLLRADSVPGLNSKTLTIFKKTYSKCVLVCRFANCPRELHGFANDLERDKHELTHKQIYQCPHPECSMHRIGLSSNKRLQQHLQQYHPEPKTTQVLPSIKPFGEYRVATDATLVNSPPPSGEVMDSRKLSGGEEQDEGDEEDEEEDDYDLLYGKLDRFAATDTFALGSTQWT